MITAEEFERQYAARSGITVERLRELGRVVRPCHCGEDMCEGWQSLSRENAAELDAVEYAMGRFRGRLAELKAEGKFPRHRPSKER